MLRLIVIAVVCTLSLIPIAGYGSNIISNTVLLIALTFALGYIALPALLLNLWPEKRQEPVQSMEQGLAKGDLIVEEYRVSTAAELEVVEDEGVHFLLTTNAGRTLYLSGQYLYDPVGRKAFPCGHFRLYRDRLSGLVYGVEALTDSFTAWPKFDTFVKKPVVPQVKLEDGKVYDQSIPELLSALGLRQSTEQASS